MDTSLTHTLLLTWKLYILINYIVMDYNIYILVASSVFPPQRLAIDWRTPTRDIRKPSVHHVGSNIVVRGECGQRDSSLASPHLVLTVLKVQSQSTFLLLSKWRYVTVLLIITLLHYEVPVESLVGNESLDAILWVHDFDLTSLDWYHNVDQTFCTFLCNRDIGIS